MNIFFAAINRFLYFCRNKNISIIVIGLGDMMASTIKTDICKNMKQRYEQITILMATHIFIFILHHVICKPII